MSFLEKDNEIDKWSEILKNIEKETVKEFADEAVKSEAKSFAIQFNIQALITSTILDVANKKFKEEARYNNLTIKFFNILRDRLSYTAKGFEIRNENNEVEKVINSPGQLGIVMFQILNDAIEKFDLEEKENEATKKAVEKLLELRF